MWMTWMMMVMTVLGFGDKKKEAGQSSRMTLLGAECVGNVTKNNAFS
jgi:hypothetical protein